MTLRRVWGPSHRRSWQPGFKRRILRNVGRPSVPRRADIHESPRFPDVLPAGSRRTHGITEPRRHGRALTGRGGRSRWQPRHRERRVGGCHVTTTGGGRVTMGSRSAVRSRRAAVAVSPRRHNGPVTRPRRGIKGGGGAVGPAPRRSVRRTNAGMSSSAALAATERPDSTRWARMEFWDGMEHAFMMPSITAEGTGVPSRPSNLAAPQRSRLSTAAASGVSPSGAGDGDDSSQPPPPHHGRGVVGGL